MGESNAKSSKKRNILFLIADDLGEFLGCYGVKSIKTPNIDKLVSQGTKFDMAFTSTASCSASRSVIYTGLHTHENGQYGLAGGRHHFTTFDHVESMPHLFNSLGYQTGIIGKVHVGPKSVYPWEIREDSGMRDVGWVADVAENFFVTAKRTDRPFHLTVGYIDPHRDLTRSGFGNQNFENLRISVPEIKPKDVEVPPYLSDLPEVRTELAEYYQSISRLDIGVGIILEALERQELTDSTIVCFISDNGPPFMNSKTTLYDAGIRLPVIIRKPHHSHPGTTHSPPRLGKSFLPILESSILLSENEWQHHVFGSHTFHEVQNYWPTRFLRTRRYKSHYNLAWRLDFPFATDIYGSLSWEGIRNTPPPIIVGSRHLKNYIWRPAEELYDLEHDPEEVKNLAEEKGYEDLVKEMRIKLEKWQLETKDLWLYRDGVSVVVNEHHREAGLRIPDRFEVDVERPGNRDVECWKAPA